MSSSFIFLWEVGPFRRIEKGSWRLRTNLLNIIINHKMNTIHHSLSSGNWHIFQSLSTSFNLEQGNNPLNSSANFKKKKSKMEPKEAIDLLNFLCILNDAISWRIIVEKAVLYSFEWNHYKLSAESFSNIILKIENAKSKSLTQNKQSIYSSKHFKWCLSLSLISHSWKEDHTNKLLSWQKTIENLQPRS